MARVTVEDCVIRVPNRFELVLMAGQRSRDISSGAALTIERDNDKNPVVALREIGDGTVDTEVLSQALVQGLQHHAEIDEPEEDDELDSLAAEQDAAVDRGEADEAAEMAEDVLSVQEETLSAETEAGEEADTEIREGAEGDGDEDGDR